MSKSIFTQKALAEAFKNLLLEMPLSKVSIKDIVARCGISRNAYYYYYKDKYELIWWIVEYELKEIVKIYDPSLELSDTYAAIFHHFYNNKKFYYTCLEYQGQNSLYHYLSNLFFDLTYEKLKELYIDENIDIYSVPIDIYSSMLSMSMLENLRMWHNSCFTENYKEYIEPVNAYINLVVGQLIETHRN